MTDFNATLLREKFVITETNPENEEDTIPLVVMSNRLHLPLIHKGKDINTEDLIIRTKNMHTAVYLGSQILQDIAKKGPLLNRNTPFNWQQAYLNAEQGIERKWTVERWIAIYNQGRVLYEDGLTDRHPFLDIVEQCDARNPDEYEKSLEIAKDAFGQAGKNVSIEYDTNIALVVNVTKNEGKCGLILRIPTKNNTFSILIHKDGHENGQPIRADQCMYLSAIFLEAIQLSFFRGMITQKLKHKKIASDSIQALQSHEARRRVDKLQEIIEQQEKMLNISYRPEKPNFSKIMYETEIYANKIFSEKS